MFFYINLFLLFTLWKKILRFKIYINKESFKIRVMKILVKQIKEDNSQSIVYLVDHNGNPLRADIVNEKEKNVLVNELLSEYFTPDDWVNNKEDLRSNVTEMSYEEYINQ